MSEPGDHLPFFPKLFEENLSYQLTGLKDLRIGDTIINVDSLTPG
jgi:hypothetical protein